MAAIRIPGLEWIGWTLLNSIWQLGLLSLLFILITGRSTRFSAAGRHNIALLFSVAGSLWFLAGMLDYAGTFSAVPDASGKTPSGNSLVSSPTLLVSLRISAFYILDQLVSFLPWLYVSVLLLRTGNLVRGLFTKRSEPLVPRVPESNNQWIFFLDRCRRDLGIRRPVILRWTAGPVMAFTRGFFRPLVFFPIALVNSLTTDQVEAILVHELAHIRRNDYVTQLWMTLFRFVFYFNPFARFLYDVVAKEREQACDDLVLDRAYPATAYAEALLTLEMFRQSRMPVALAAAGAHPLLLAERIRRICGLPAGPSAVTPVWRITALLIVFALTAVLVQPGAESKAGQKKSALAGLAPLPGAERTGKQMAPPALAELIVVLPPGSSLPAALPSSTQEALPGALPAPLPERPRATPEVVSEERDSAASPDSSLETLQIGENVEQVNVNSGQEEDNNTNVTDELSGNSDYAAGRTVRNFSYRTPVTAPVPAPVVVRDQPYVPSSSFEYLVADTVPAIALQSLQENKPAVVQLLAKWKMLQWQQSATRALEQKYQTLKEAEQKNIRSLPARQAELKKTMERLKDQMKKRKAEIDRLSALLADGPVIYI